MICHDLETSAVEMSDLPPLSLWCSKLQKKNDKRLLLVTAQEVNINGVLLRRTENVHQHTDERLANSKQDSQR